VRTRLGWPALRADEASPATTNRGRFRLGRQTLRHQVWRANALRVHAGGRAYRMNRRHQLKHREEKCFLSNARQAGLVRAACRFHALERGTPLLSPRKKSLPRRDASLSRHDRTSHISYAIQFHQQRNSQAAASVKKGFHQCNF
jgi:hypothetical protein